ncbi:hypothetical protein MRQ86_00570 [Streptomyces sp. MMS21 TC-5]|uniref:hypothetical protein n=1 Tax=Streptomyces sp. MMS21 TC-5 TaxID=2925833 RepID=UPI001F609507|nr:hypothetical protein [Streptomyces sp. MMS21 TC-5]MCI4078871.1 hypothetical protein [Streptomyces sp. MMS21 TC-5]
MALLCYSDLEDADRVGVSALHASLEGWVLGLLDHTQDRASRLPAGFVAQSEDRALHDEAAALRTIRFIRYAQEELADRNAYLQYLCPDCPRDGSSQCPARNRPRRPGPAIHTTLYTVPHEPLPQQSRPWLVQADPAASRVLERLCRIAKQQRDRSPGAAGAAVHAAFVRRLYEMARQWRDRGLSDAAVNVDEAQDTWFVRDVTSALMFGGARNRWDTDARHSAVNFIAAVLHILAEQIGDPQAPTAREALMAALVARNACIEGDTASVDEFSRTWLNINHPRTWRAAVEMALLGDWVDALGQQLSSDAAIMELLHRHTDREHRCLQPLWERKSGGGRVRMLEDPVAPNLSLRDVVTDHRRPEDSLLHGQVESPRLRAVLSQLAPAERAVAMAYSAQRMTWAEAGVEGGAGDPEAFGERVRRKLKRLGARYRHAVAGPSSPAAADR